MKHISNLERFLIGFISSLFLPFAKLYQNGSLLQTSENGYLAGLLGPFIVLGVLMGIYAWAVEKDETDAKRLFRTCFAMPGVLLSLLGTTGANPTEGVAKAYPPNVQIVCERKVKIVQGAIDTYDILTNNHRPRYLLLSKNPAKAHRYHQYLVVENIQYGVKAKLATKPKARGLYIDLRNCKTFRIERDFPLKK